MEKKGVDHEDFVMDDLCPTGENLTKVEIIKGLRDARKRANARCYAFVSVPFSNMSSSEPLQTPSNTFSILLDFVRFLPK